MAGGSITIIPQGKKIQGAYHAAGNAILYGATGGQLFVAGTVGQRFGVRNSGGIGVVEGCSAHGGEYMTGGTLIVLGKVGFNFAAGMTGGKAIVLSTQKNFKEYVSKAAPEYRKLNDIDILELRAILELHVEKTNSKKAQYILEKEKNWTNMFAVFGGLADLTDNQSEQIPDNVKALD